MAEVLSLPLKFPFTSAAGVLISSLPIKRLKRKDVSAAQGVSENQNVVEDMLAAKMLGITLEDLGEFDIADAKSVTRLMSAMMDGKSLAEVVVEITAATGVASSASIAEVFRENGDNEQPAAKLGHGPAAGAENATV
ncbi:phage tail assembly protein [Pseudomonas sp. J380]|uniref:phage tail assembly protein n=1 Tax=Pseudomonas sp. J380 TaxID=2605424 RepID=UPI001317AFF6|nr:phage tail assembly protein [Pseudomonas sp. J380]QHA95848.1 phage tail assembly protein [Pseudomonas sp. J380]